VSIDIKHTIARLEVVTGVGSAGLLPGPSTSSLLLLYIYIYIDIKRTIASLEVVTGVSAARLLPGLGGVHGLRSLDEQVLQLKRLDEVRVPNHRAV